MYEIAIYPCYERPIVFLLRDGGIMDCRYIRLSSLKNSNSLDLQKLLYFFDVKFRKFVRANRIGTGDIEKIIFIVPKRHILATFRDPVDRYHEQDRTLSIGLLGGYFVKKLRIKNLVCKSNFLHDNN